MTKPTTPSVLFVCVKNSGKSQMVAGLMRDVAGDDVAVHSAGTKPGDIGIDISGEQPKPIDPRLLSKVDLVITLGREAHIEPVDGVAVENWDTDEPSARGIDGIERMELIRDDIAARVAGLAKRLLDTPTPNGRHSTDIGSPP